MDAVACHRPAIVKRPDNRDTLFAKKPEENGVIEEASMDVVDMNHVRLYLIDYLQESLRGTSGSSPLGIKKGAFNIMQNFPGLVGDLIIMKPTLINIACPVRHIYIPPLGQGQATYSLNNLSC